MTQTTSYPVEEVVPDSPLEPPQPIHLPEGSKYERTLRGQTPGIVFRQVVEPWLVANGLHDHQYVAKPGVWVFIDPTGQQWLVVDYITGGTWTDDEKDGAARRPAQLRGRPLREGRPRRHRPGPRPARRPDHRAHPARRAAVARPLTTTGLLANPYLVCGECGARVTRFGNIGDGEGSVINLPCGHAADSRNTCPSWGPVDGCCCAEHLGYVPHDTLAETG
jgi:hypothetical protein